MCPDLQPLGQVHVMLGVRCRRLMLDWFGAPSTGVVAVAIDLAGRAEPALMPSSKSSVTWYPVVECADEFGISVSYDPLVFGERRGG